MPIENHIAALREKHAELQAEIDSEERRIAPNSLLVQKLKRQKLQIKDKIAAIPNAQITPFIPPAVATIESSTALLRMAG